MLMNGCEKEKLFAKEVPITLKNVNSNHIRKVRLFFVMEWKETSSYNGKVLKITLTDNNDIFFFYYLEQTEEEFNQLKLNQDLLINFLSFPQHILKYIEMCLHEEHNPKPKFLLVLAYSDQRGTKPQLDIIETSEFKHLTHLHLEFNPVTDIVLKQHQSAIFKHLKETNQQLRNELDYTEKDLKGKLATCQQMLNCKIEEIELVRKELNVELSVKESNHQRKLEEQKEQLNSKHKNDIDRLEKEIETKENNFHQDIDLLQSKVKHLDIHNKELEEKNSKHEFTIRELRSKVLSLEDETNRLKSNLQSSKLKYDNLLSEFHRKESHIDAQDEKLRDLQQKLSCKEHTILKLKQEIETERTEKISYDNKYQEKEFLYNMCEKQRKALEVDKEKLNDVIVCLQDKIKEIKDAEKSLRDVVAKHKMSIDEKDRTLMSTKQEIRELNITLQAKDAEIKNLIDSKHNLQAQIKDLERSYHEAENMRKFMHRQMTQAGVLPMINPPPHLVSPTAVAEQELAKITSQRPKNSPPGLTGKSAVSKSVRIAATSPVYNQKSSFPPHSHRTPGTDSAYCTTSLHSNQKTPEILAGNYKMNANPPDFDIESDVIEGAFGNGQRNLKHSTAKKTAKPVSSSTPKSSKKR